MERATSTQGVFVLGRNVTREAVGETGVSEKHPLRRSNDNDVLAQPNIPSGVTSAQNYVGVVKNSKKPDQKQRSPLLLSGRKPSSSLPARSASRSLSNAACATPDMVVCEVAPPRVS